MQGATLRDAQPPCVAKLCRLLLSVTPLDVSVPVVDDVGQISPLLSKITDVPCFEHAIDFIGVS
jgi:hypothetical protein